MKAARESAILHERGDFWVRRAARSNPRTGAAIYEVLRQGVTHSAVVGVFDLGDRGLPRAIEDCNRRANEKDPPA